VKCKSERKYYRFDEETSLPTLLYNYHLKTQTTEDGYTVNHFYSQLTFIVSTEDNRLWIKYNQVSQMLVNGVPMDIP
jgi:hypothetical protein